jgi:short-subunit dehydrogenase
MCRGRIINMGGGAGRITVPMYGALSASKAALDSVSDAFRMELKYQGVDIIYMEPGGIDTEFFKKSAETALQGGLAGGAEGGRIYRRAINAVKRAFSQSKPEPVDVIVTAIMKALTAPRPSPRYVVGKENRMHLMLLPKLPTRVRDRIVMSAFGLTKDLFV